MITDGIRRRFAVCGLSGRALSTFVDPLLRGEWSSSVELVGVLDADGDRARQFVSTRLPDGHPAVPVFGSDDLAQLIGVCRPDVVVVASPDATHAAHIVSALAAGVDVITEKPMTATATQAAQVLRAASSSDATLTVGHNMRYTARHRALRRMIMDGAVGRPVQVTLDYHVDTRHGASYFVRWNRRQAMSGTLAVHKSCHHLDLIGWLLADRPTTVYARGDRSFYGRDSPHRPPAGAEPDAYRRDQQGSWLVHDPAEQPRSGGDGLTYPLQYPAGSPWTLYDDSIDIEDRYAALVTYERGATLSYTIDFSSPWEGYRLGVTGTHGRLEALYGHDRDGVPLPGSDQVVHQPLFADPRSVKVETGAGGHDGADEVMLHDMLAGASAESIELGLVATPLQAAEAVAAGEAIWRSARTGAVVDVAALLGPVTG